MATLERTLAEFTELLEDLQGIVEACDALGVRITNPRRLRLDQRRLAPFVGLGRLTGDEANDLALALEEIDHPDLVIEQLQAADITGSAVRKFERLGVLKTALTNAANRRIDQEYS